MSWQFLPRVCQITLQKVRTSPKRGKACNKERVEYAQRHAGFIEQHKALACLCSPDSHRLIISALKQKGLARVKALEQISQFPLHTRDRCPGTIERLTNRQMKPIGAADRRPGFLARTQNLFQFRGRIYGLAGSHIVTQDMGS